MMAYLGPKGTYSHQAALLCFPEDELVPQDFLKDVVHSVYIGECQYGILPIENSTNGGVYPALEALDRCTSVRIHGDVYVPVLHNLYSFGRSQYTRLYSHPQVWGQVERFVSSGQYELVSCSSTAAALEKAREDPEGAAIASEHGGKVMGVEPTKTEINDESGNNTRFVILSLSDPKPGKTAIVIGKTGRVIDAELNVREVELQGGQIEGGQIERVLGYSGNEWNNKT